MEIGPTKSPVLNETIARLKAAKGEGSSLTSAEQRLTDLLDLKPAAQEKARQGRKLDNYLQLFNSALKWVNGGKTLPQNLTDYVDKIDRSGTKIDTKA